MIFSSTLWDRQTLLLPVKYKVAEGKPSYPTSPPAIKSRLWAAESTPLRRSTLPLRLEHCLSWWGGRCSCVVLEQYACSGSDVLCKTIGAEDKEGEARAFGRQSISNVHWRLGEQTFPAFLYPQKWRALQNLYSCDCTWRELIRNENSETVKCIFTYLK